MRKIFTFLIIAMNVSLSFSQGEGNHWYFGYNAGLDFSTGSPLPDLNGALNTWEGCSSVSDKNGNLLFYTDGGSVYDRNHTIMPNGTGLLGNSSSTQSAIIVKKPGTDTLYYIFTTPAVSTGGLYYSEVNMRLNGGLGDIVVATKNTNLLPVVGERVTAARHSNGVYTWVITKATNTNAYNAFLINCNGVQPPVVTNIGFTASGNNAGTTVASPDNRRIGSTFFSTTNGIEIMDFDNTTGVLSNPITQNLGAYPYGACFSPNSKLFYYTNIANGNALQLDLTAGNGNPSDILASTTVVGNINASGLGGFRAGALQLGPDGKIYMAENGQGNVSVINNPNISGTGCNFVGDAVGLGGKLCGLGLPALFLNFIDTTVIEYDIQCVNTPVVYRINGDSTALDSVHWDFGDISSGPLNYSDAYAPAHTYSGPGTYTVQLIRFFLCGSDTNSVSVTIFPNSVSASINGSDSLCAGEALSLNASGGATYSWIGPGNFADTTQAINIGNPLAGLYTLIATDTNGCADTTTSSINIFPKPIAVATANSPVPVGDTIFLTADTLSGISWSGPNSFTSNQPNPQITSAAIADSGTYQLIKTNIYGCSDTTEILVNVYQPEIADNGIDDDNDNLIDCADPDLATLPQCYKCDYDSVAWQAVIPEPGFNRGIAIKYTGFEQHFTVPSGVTAIKIKAWGAGGGGCCFASIAGGAGGYTMDSITTQTGETFIVVTGEGGWTTRFLNQTARSTFGLGGSGNSTGATGTSEASSGGGLSGVFLSTFSQLNARVIAGGGGGSGDVGNSDETPGGNGNNPLAGGYLPLIGENGTAGFGGGGGGYVGGITGIGRFTPGAVAEAGEAGSGYKHTSGGVILFSPELNTNPPETTNIHYIPGVGLGGMSNTPIGLVGDLKSGGDGLVVIQWFEPIEDLVVTASKTAICNGDTLSMTATGPGTYAWSPASTLNDSTSAQVIATPVSDITYQVISNNNNCMDTAQIQITVNPLPTASFGADSICFGLATTLSDSSLVSAGNITNWSWNFGDNTPSNNGANPSHQYASCGNFNVQLLVTTNNGCVDSLTKPVAVYCLPVPDAGVNDTICFSESTVISVVPNGTGYTYSWNAPANTNFSTTHNPTVNPASTTTYTVALTDAHGCSGTDSVTIFADSEIMLTKTITNVSCNSACDGQIDLIASGGTTPYQYNWSGGCTAASCTNLCPDTYSVTVTDAWGCIATTDTSITEPTALLAFINSFTATSCNAGCDGTASANATGGTPGTGYVYSWNSIPAQNSATADSLCEGVYICSVTDANSCIASDTVIITEPTVITVLTTTSPTACSHNTGTATATVFGGTPGYDFNWSPGGNTSQTADSLSAGTYTVVVTDTNGCTQSQTAVVVTTPSDITILTTTSPTDCNDSTGSATATAFGGTPGYSFNWTPGGSTGQTANELAAGTYSVTVTDTNGCSQSQVAVVTTVPGPTVIVTASDNNIMSGNTTILTTTGNGTYHWSPSLTLSCDTCQNLVASPTETTSYCVVVTDTNSCADSACITILVEFPCELGVPNAFSPNNDGKNDAFTLHGWDKCVSEFSIIIFNRWGEKIFESSNPSLYWDGSSQNERTMNSAVFVYVITATLQSGEKITRQGNISLIR